MPGFEWNDSDVASRNAKNLKDLGDEASASVLASGSYILIGDHPEEYVNAIRENSQVSEGTVTIKKGGPVAGHGSLTFKGISSGQSDITDHVAGFSKKTV